MTNRKPAPQDTERVQLKTLKSLVGQIGLHSCSAKAAAKDGDMAKDVEKDLKM
jgi:hypothetical protein